MCKKIGIWEQWGDMYHILYGYIYRIFVNSLVIFNSCYDKIV